jgi:isoleucyl-tRNA synthetase
LILARELVARTLGEGAHEIVRSALGRELDGIRYERLFDYLPASGDICRVRAADFVTTADGTGIVHVAPAYGEDDLKLGLAHGLNVVHGVGDDGYFVPEVTPVAGKFFKEADPTIIEVLRERGLLFRAETYRHNYPFGWRTGDPLIYYAKNAWYIRTTAFRERLVALNRTINWVPEHIREGRFGDWLENNIDWALSRERFWGTPLPLWTDGDGDYICIGSVAELEKRVGRKLGDVDLHRPAIDEIAFSHKGREYRRVPEVIDCWFDSGAMPYAQLHYPFENEKAFSRSFPAEFICEAIDQTRGWFYTLHAIATLVSDSVAYRNVVCLSHIVDADGKKMSKSLGNVLNPYEVFDSAGADALRWYFTARVAPDVQKRLSVEIVSEVASTFINTLWNTYAFFVMYARLDGVDLARNVPYRDRPEIDRWIIALLEETISTVTAALDRYDAQRAGLAIERLVDQLSNWYVRRNRRRFWKAAAGDDKQAAYLTLYECLDVAHRLMAPFVPFLSESIYQNLVRPVNAGAPLSVHMTEWPRSRPERHDRELLAQTEVVQRVVGLGRAARNTSRLKVRQPLARMLVRVPDEAAAAAVRTHTEQILDELNIKTIELVPRDATLVSYRIKPNLPVVGKSYGKLIPALREYLSRVDGAAIAAAAARGEAHRATVAGQEVELEPAMLLIETESARGFACAEGEGYLVGLDTTLDAELRREGLAREVVRAVQDARKQAGLEVSDRIVLDVEGDAAVTAAVAAHRPYIEAETLTGRWAPLRGTTAFVAELEEPEFRCTIRLAKIDGRAASGAAGIGDDVQ